MELADYDYDDLQPMMGPAGDFDYNDLDMDTLAQLYEEDPSAFADMYSQYMQNSAEDPQPQYYVHFLHQFQECVLPSLQSIAQSFLPFFVLCFVAHCGKYAMLAYNKPKFAKPEKTVEEDAIASEGSSLTEMKIDAVTYVHIVMAMCGLAVAYQSFGIGNLYLVVLSLTIYSLLRVIDRSVCGIVISLLCLVYLVVGEVVALKQAQLWHQMRGVQMLLCMRGISIAYDMKNNVIKEVPNFVEYVSYMFCVGTLLFGPWISFTAYLRAVSQHKVSFQWLKCLVVSSTSAIVCLIVSNCFTSFVRQFVEHNWLTAYLDAQSFRFSHYFICYLSQVTLIATGLAVRHSDSDVPDSEWNAPVTKPWYIEVPRSLVDVVIYWNIPMHKWLKSYVFRPTKSKCGVLVGLLATYAASALLHGISFQLGAVLLSLAWYTAVEYYLRRVLGGMVDACIGARSCGATCRYHKYKERGTLWVAWINHAFTVLAMYHLAYLGVMFNSDQQQDTGYSMSHTLRKWKNLNYASHKVMFYLSIFCLSIWTFRKASFMS